MDSHQFLEASQKVEEAHFVKQAEHLSSYWENGDQIKSTKFKHEIVTSILEYLQCLNIYATIISCNEPHYRVVHLLAYQQLVIE